MVTFTDIRRVFRDARTARGRIRGAMFTPDAYALLRAQNGISVVSTRSSVSVRRGDDMALYEAVLIAAGFSVATTVRNGRVTSVTVIT